MIKTIYSGSHDVIVSGLHSTTPYINPNYSGAGMIKFDPASGNFQVNDGMQWVNIPNDTVTIDLSSENKEILKWAKRKYLEECELEKLAEENSAIADLVNQIKEKQSQLEMVKMLMKKDLVQTP